MTALMFACDQGHEACQSGDGRSPARFTWAGRRGAGAPAPAHDGTVLLLVHAWAAYCGGGSGGGRRCAGTVPAAAFAAVDRLLAALAARDRDRPALTLRAARRLRVPPARSRACPDRHFVI